MENIQPRKVNARSLSSILTISMLICLFVSFILGTICAGSFYDYNQDQINWSFAAPFLVFTIFAIICAVCKFFLCTMNLKKEYPSKDTIKFQFILEAIGLVILLFTCISIAFIQGKQLTKELVAPILTSSLSFAIEVACAGLAYHNYK